MAALGHDTTDGPGSIADVSNMLLDHGADLLKAMPKVRQRLSVLDGMFDRWMIDRMTDKMLNERLGGVFARMFGRSDA